MSQTTKVLGGKVFFLYTAGMTHAEAKKLAAYYRAKAHKRGR